MVEFDTAHGLYIYLTSKDADEIVEDIERSNAKEKHEVTVKIYDQIQHFTLSDFCKRLDIKPLGENKDSKDAQDGAN